MSNLHLVTGYAGREHIKSADQGSFNAALLGNDEYVLERGSKFAPQIISNNIVRIKDGDVLMQGRHIRLNEDTYVDLDFDNGQQNYKRNDLIVIRYTKDSASDIEEANLVVIKGEPTTGTPADPEYFSGDIIHDHVLVNDMPLYRVPFNGLNIQDLVTLFEVLPTWKTLKAQSVEETQTALQQSVDQAMGNFATASGQAISSFQTASGQKISAFESQSNQKMSDFETASGGKISQFEQDAAEVLANFPQVLKGTSDPTNATVGIVGQTYVNTATNKIFYCIAHTASTNTWVVSTLLPQVIVKAPNGTSVTITNGSISYSGTTASSQKVFSLPNYGTWTVTGTKNSRTLTEVVEVSAVKQYTVRLPFIVKMTVTINTANSNPTNCVTYADDAVGMTPGSDDWDAFFGHYPCLLKNGAEVGRLNPDNFAEYANGIPADITSGEAGDVMIAFPRRGLKITTSGSVITVSMTNDPNDSNFEYYAHRRGSTQKDVFYLGAYKGYKDGNNKLRSLCGKQATHSITIGTARTYAHNNGSGYEQSAFYQLVFRQAMFILKYKTLDSQTAVGRGYVDDYDAEYYEKPTGETNTYGMDCQIIKRNYPDYMTDGLHSVKLFGLEDFWGGIWEWIDGLVTDSSRNILTNTTNFQDNGKGSGYMSAASGVSNGGGWMKQPQGTSQCGFVRKTDGGSETTYFCDSANLYGGCVASFGGSWVSGSNAGAFRLRVDYSASYANEYVAARLMYL